MAEVFAIGSNGSGQLGIGHKEDVSVPKPVIFGGEDPTSVTSIHAGGNHTLLLSSGRLLSSGDAVSGARGVVNDQSITFQPVFGLDHGIHTSKRNLFCAATWEASIIVQEDHDGKATLVYSFGTGNKGELGQGEMLFRSVKPQLIKDFPPPGMEIVDLQACISHVVAVLNNGDVYGWGSGRKGQLGTPDEIVYSPRKILGLDFQVVKAACGREFTYLVGDASEGKHLVLGSDKWKVRSCAPVSIKQWKQIGAGWGNLVILLENGKVLSWGRNDHGQLAPDGLPVLAMIVAGSEHSVGLTQDGDVVAWGWGEHGNCGPSTTNGDVRGRWNVIASSKYLSPHSQIRNIGAGCATSWISISA